MRKLRLPSPGSSNEVPQAFLVLMLVLIAVALSFLTPLGAVLFAMGAVAILLSSSSGGSGPGRPLRAYARIRPRR